jgi:Predicted Zn-dependent protease (DUF2268)
MVSTGGRCDNCDVGKQYLMRLLVIVKVGILLKSNLWHNITMNKANLKVHILQSDIHLIPYAGEIKKIANDVTKQVKKLLPFRESVDIVIYRYFANSPELATSGYTPTGNVVWIYTDPAQKNYKKMLRLQMSKVLAHELHHASRTQKVGTGKTLGETLVFEGLGAHFESEIIDGDPTSFYTQFSGKQLEALSQTAKAEFNNNNYSYEDWFFGNEKRKIPKHAGYALSYWLVAKSLKGKKASELVHITPGQILKNIV